MSKKVLSVMLALVMVLSVFSVSAFAAVNSRYEKIDEDAGETQIAHTQKWSLVAPEAANADGTYTVDVVLETNYYTGIISFDIIAEGAELVKADKGSAITYDADVAYFEGMTHVDIIPNPTLAQAAGLAPKFAAGSVVAKVTYRLTGSSATLKLMNDSKCAKNPGGSLFAVRLENETLASNTVYYGQRVIDANGNDIAVGAEIASVTLGSAAEPPTLAVIDGTIGVINTDYTEYGLDLNECTGYIYGVEPEEAQGVTDVFEVIGDGEIEIVANEAGSEAGTGTIVNVLDSDGNAVETYVLIIFGDIDGDGEITAFDGGNMLLHDAWGYGDNMRIEEPELLFAGDLDIDGDITAFDGGNVLLHDAWGYGDNMRMYQSEIIDLL